MNIFLIITILTYPVNPDGMGLFSSVSPYLPEKNSIHLFTHVFGAYGPRPCPSDTSRLEWYKSDRHLYGDEVSGIGYTILSQCELFLASHGYGKYIERVEKPIYRPDTKFLDFPQIMFGIKAGFPMEIGEYTMAYGFMTWVSQWIDALTAKEINRRISDEFDPTKPWDRGVGVSGLLGFKSPRISSYLNIGYTGFFHHHNGYRQEEQGLYGAGVEFTIFPYINIGTEFSRTGPGYSITPQVKLLFKDLLKFSFGLSFPISNFDWVPDNTLVKTPRFMVGLDLNFGLEKAPVIDKNILVKGKIYDSLSKMPICGTVTFIGPSSGTIKSEAGLYRLGLQKPGAYRIWVEHPDYKWQEKVVKVMAYDSINVDFSLSRKVTWSITGKVIDKESQKPVVATIRLIGKKSSETVSDALTGEYRLWIEAGSYNLLIDASDYKSKKIPVAISNIAPLHQDILLESQK